MTPLVLHRVLAVTAEGLPVLAGVNARVVATQRFTPDAVGREAVCQMATDPEGLIVALGVLAGPAGADPGVVELRCGKAALTLAGDGSIRLEGSDVRLTSSGRMRVSGAIVDLN